ncbi:hypothetical protein TIFTF001_039689 [Ficus carica]|uniref:Uncharacterized protein n=1 Tax=Ficus carica TaxID=3494 RepID=A0AA88E9L4_FICCA|nr:hypothetical protein TIFTF001_039689 [Ficus carica]
MRTPPRITRLDNEKEPKNVLQSEPQYKEDATNGGGNPFDKLIVNATENSDKFE